MKMIIGLVTVVAIGLGAMWYFVLGARDKDIFAQCRSSQVAGGSDVIGGPFTLVDETGKTVTDKDVITKPSLLYFGYTFCPDVCPLDNARNAEAVDILEKNGKIVTPIFISIDPARDTPEVLAEFTDNLHPRMIGLTGTDEQVRAASKAYRTYFNRHDETGDEFYLVDHSTQTYLVLPDYGFVEFFGRAETPELMAEKVSCFVDAAAEAN